ncbi:MAG: hypothetical protein ACREKS_00365 [Candidatus Rokuibacteriota bacterium]
MRYVLLTAHQVLGIAHKNDAPDVVLFEGRDPDTRVLVTRKLDHHLAVLDRQLALASMMMRAMIGQALSSDFPEKLAKEIEAVRQRRARSLAADGVLVIEARGDIQAVLKEPVREVGDFVLCFDALDKKVLSAALQPRIASVLAAVRIGGAGSYELRRVGSGSYLLDPDGKVIHSFSLEGGEVTAYVSYPLREEQVVRVQEDIELILANQQLTRAIQLFAHSLDRDTDALRTFLSAWSAMEIMIGKIFPSYQARLVSEFAKVSTRPGLTRYLERIADIMKDKHSLGDKFAVVSIFLDEQDQSGDIARFGRIKEIRDRLAHGEEVPDASLPNRDLQALFEKYFRRHLRRGA